MDNNAVLPQIHRGRGYFLYSRDGKRFYDCWLADGAAILGHKPPKLLNKIKNIAEKGIWGYYQNNPSVMGIATICTKLFPGWKLSQIVSLPSSCRLRAGDSDSFFEALQSVHRPEEPVLTDINAVMHFFFGASAPIDDAKEYLCVYVPFNWENRYILVCVRNSDKQIAHTLSLVESTGIKETLKHLVFRQKQCESKNYLSRLLLPKSLWRQNGHYIHFIGSDTQYADLRSVFLEHRIILSPYSTAAALPLHVSESMVSLWNKATSVYISLQR